MNTSLHQLEQCSTSGFAHHATMSPASLQQVLLHYCEHVRRLSIMSVQCGLLLQHSALVHVLKVRLGSRSGLA